jgi:hypothetical protein
MAFVRDSWLGLARLRGLCADALGILGEERCYSFIEDGLERGIGLHLYVISP